MPPRGARPSPMRALAELDNANAPVHVLDPELTITPSEDLAPGAQAYWDSYVPDLRLTGILVESDAIMLTRLVVYLDLADRARAELDGSDIGSPEAKRVRVALKDYEAMAARIAADFGLNPVSRTRLGLMTMRGLSLVEELERSGI